MTGSRSPRIPALDLVLGYGPALLVLLLAVFAWVLPVERAPLPVALAQLFAAAVLVFIAGVRRGAGFAMAGGPRPFQIATMAWLFLLGLAGLAFPPQIALPALLVGYGSVALLDSPAARRGEVPAHFARLRPPQMAIAALGLGLAMARVYSAG